MSAMAIGAVWAVAVILLAPFCVGEIRVSEIRLDARSIIPFDEFGFTHRGHLEMTVRGASYKAVKEIDPSHMGFFLSTREAWIHVLHELQRGEIHCVLDTNQYTLVFANCIPETLVSMDVRTVMYNIEGGTGAKDYLSAGETVLPRLYFCLFLIYLVLSGIWIYVVVKHRATAYQIHVFMIALVCLKALNLICEAEDKSYIKRTGTAHGWDVLFYIFSFLKGIMLFTLIVLIGTGWSFLKPYLQGKEKKVLMVVIPLQVIANIATVVIDETGPYAKDWLAWKQMLLLVDVICCCAVLFPIVWSIKNLREAAHTDGKAAVNLMKLTLFRQYYIVVVGYIYFTRVVVYALATITAYQYAWTSILAGELATLGFYVFTGYKFQPIRHNPYFVIDEDEEEAAAQALKMDDDFEL
ncbi:hypothetical protein SUGI_1161320 [Cryptomeria japonica]|nr:hypothetical protein SUGI_1161320 [Cryptomeria japonica]